MIIRFVVTIVSIAVLCGCGNASLQDRIENTRLDATQKLSSASLTEYERDLYTSALATLSGTGSASIDKPVIVASYILPAYDTRSMSSLAVYWLDTHPEAESFIYYFNEDVDTTFPALTSYKKSNFEAAKTGVLYSMVFWSAGQDRVPFLKSGTNVCVSIRNKDGTLSEKHKVGYVLEDGSVQ